MLGDQPVHRRQEISLGDQPVSVVQEQQEISVGEQPVYVVQEQQEISLYTSPSQVQVRASRYLRVDIYCSHRS